MPISLERGETKLTCVPIWHRVPTEREVKKATRDLANLLTGMETPLSRLEAVQKKYTELLADMKRLDRDNVKSKKRADQLQKEKDQGRSELSKTVSMKEKLEKLCRELTRENKKIKVCIPGTVSPSRIYTCSTGRMIFAYTLRVVESE